MARNPARTPRIPPAATMYLRPDDTTRRSTPPATASDRQPGGRSNCPDTVIGGSPSILYGSANWKVFHCDRLLLVLQHNSRSASSLETWVLVSTLPVTGTCTQRPNSKCPTPMPEPCDSPITSLSFCLMKFHNFGGTARPEFSAGLRARRVAALREMRLH